MEIEQLNKKLDFEIDLLIAAILELNKQGQLCPQTIEILKHQKKMVDIRLSGGN